LVGGFRGLRTHDAKVEHFVHEQGSTGHAENNHPVILQQKAPHGGGALE
jgi:hypothetical protein